MDKLEELNMSTGSSSPVPDLRYPIGRYRPPGEISEADRAKWLAELQNLPTLLQAAVGGLNASQLDTPYREGGWTLRQLVHHLADSHLNSYTRFRLAMTEDSPVIKPYAEKLWAELPDARQAPVELSLVLLEALHARWALLLSSLTEDDFARTFKHPEQGEIRLDWTLGLYAWHGRHHIAHIEALKEREGWSTITPPLQSI